MRFEITFLFFLSIFFAVCDDMMQISSDEKNNKIVFIVSVQQEYNENKK